MTPLGLLSAFLGFLKAVVAPLLFWRGGKAKARSEAAETLLGRIERANEAKRRAGDPAHRKRLRDKFHE